MTRFNFHRTLGALLAGLPLAVPGIKAECGPNP